MGRIKTMLIKRSVNKLMELNKDKFTDNFEDNKRIVAEVADIPSKKIRNIVCGYVTKLTKKEKSKLQGGK